MLNKNKSTLDPANSYFNSQFHSMFCSNAESRLRTKNLSTRVHS